MRLCACRGRVFSSCQNSAGPRMTSARRHRGNLLQRSDSPVFQSPNRRAVPCAGNLAAWRSEDVLPLARRARPRLSHHRRRACPTDQPMAPGADIGGAANRQIADGMSLRSARGAQVKDLPSKGAGTSATSQKTEAPVLTARERLRMHVNRNLALQQTSNSDKGPASAGGPPAAPRGASPANSNTPPPTSHPGIASKRGLGPITDTRLGKRGLSPDDTSPASSPGVDQVHVSNKPMSPKFIHANAYNHDSYGAASDPTRDNTFHRWP